MENSKKITKIAGEWKNDHSWGFVMVDIVTGDKHMVVCREYAGGGKND